MKATLLLIALLQASSLPTLLAATSACGSEPSMVHHAGHDGMPAPSHAPDEGSDCTHCPPADCARHLACATLTTAVVPEPVALPLPPHAVRLRLKEAGPARSQPQPPPSTPPRLIA